jgi:hypothetical protein
MLHQLSRAFTALVVVGLVSAGVLGVAGADVGDPVEGDLVPLIDRNGNRPICSTNNQPARIPLEPPDDLAVVSGDGVVYPNMDAAVADMELRGLVTRQRVQTADGFEEGVTVSAAAILYPHIPSVCTRWNPMVLTR